MVYIQESRTNISVGHTVWRSPFSKSIYTNLEAIIQYCKWYMWMTQAELSSHCFTLKRECSPTIQVKLYQTSFYACKNYFFCGGGGGGHKFLPPPPHLVHIKQDFLCGVHWGYTRKLWGGEHIPPDPPPHSYAPGSILLNLHNQIGSFHETKYGSSSLDHFPSTEKVVKDIQ